MPTIKIKDFDSQDYCGHPEHDPPTMIVFEPGEYEHTCPGCGKKQRFIVPMIGN